MQPLRQGEHGHRARRVPYAAFRGYVARCIFGSRLAHAGDGGERHAAHPDADRLAGIVKQALRRSATHWPFSSRLPFMWARSEATLPGMGAFASAVLCRWGAFPGRR